MYLLLMVIFPVEIVLKDKVDLIEVNHYYNEDGKHVFDQVIFYNWNDDHFDVVAWRLLLNKHQWPLRERNFYMSTWYDEGILRNVKANLFRETWTQYDPDIYEREKLPKEKRKQLIRLTPESR